MAADLSHQRLTVLVLGRWSWRVCIGPGSGEQAQNSIAASRIAFASISAIWPHAVPSP